MRVHEALGWLVNQSLPDAIEAVQGERVGRFVRVFGFRVGIKSLPSSSSCDVTRFEPVLDP
jgi:hypothetical protein